MCSTAGPVGAREVLVTLLAWLDALPELRELPVAYVDVATDGATADLQLADDFGDAIGWAIRVAEALPAAVISVVSDEDDCQIYMISAVGEAPTAVTVTVTVLLRGVARVRLLASLPSAPACEEGVRRWSVTVEQLRTLARAEGAGVGA